MLFVSLAARQKRKTPTKRMAERDRAIFTRFLLFLCGTELQVGSGSGIGTAVSSGSIGSDTFGRATSAGSGFAASGDSGIESVGIVGGQSINNSAIGISNRAVLHGINSMFGLFC